MNNGIMEINIQDKKKESLLERSFYMLNLYIYLGVKRLFDIICALIGCLLLIPIYIITKLCYVASGDFAPVLFVQKRIGKNGKEFNFYKFRSMVPDADKILFELMEKDEAIAKEYSINKKLKNDPRITKIGKVLRASSLDEIPQFLNILRNEMSMIGNRPYLPREKEDMGTYYNDIIKTKPGLTGLWQTSGRSKTTFEKRLKIESYYSKNMSLKMDLKIFFKTFTVVLFGKGAK